MIYLNTRDFIWRSDPRYFKSFVCFDFKKCLSYDFDELSFLFLKFLSENPISSENFLIISKSVIDKNQLSFLKKKNIISNDLEVSKGTFIEHENQVFNTGIASFPTELEVALTRGCNQNCIHCNVNAIPEKIAKPPSSKLWNKFFDDIEKEGILKVTVSGGEPMTHTEWPTILKHLAKKSFFKIILTNGTLITEEICKIMKKNGGFSLSISLDGVPRVHDQFRRDKGGYKRTLEGIDLLNKYNIDYVISSVLHSGNISSAKEVIDVAKNHNAQLVVFTPLSRIGRARSKNAITYYPEQNKLDRCKKIIIAYAKQRNINLIIGNTESKTSIELINTYDGSTQMSKRNPGLCKAGVYSCAIDDDGSVYSCLRGLQDKIFPFGNIFSDTLFDIWGHHNTWRAFRDATPTFIPCRIEEIRKSNKKRLCTRQKS